jgi:hypothetical protein
VHLVKLLAQSRADKLSALWCWLHPFPLFHPALAEPMRPLRFSRTSMCVVQLLSCFDTRLLFEWLRAGQRGMRQQAGTLLTASCALWSCRCMRTGLHSRLSCAADRCWSYSHGTTPYCSGSPNMFYVRLQLEHSLRWWHTSDCRCSIAVYQLSLSQCSTATCAASEAQHSRSRHCPGRDY